MQVQKGLVKYKDRSDILCTYGITEDGKTYYFLEGNVIPNGNIVATTVLVEAIDPLVLCSSIGVIDPNGNVIIPFENKAIKTIANDLLLVEKATPVTESVIEAIELRSDPQSASRLVTTPAVIKENINAKMGAEGRFVFNDQFSEATICDVNGNNLVNNELYSFVGVTQDKLYLSKNTPESFVSEFSLETKQLVLTPEMGDPMLNIGAGDTSEFTVDLDTVQQNGIQVAKDAEMATAAAMNGAEVAMQEDEALRNAPPEQTVESTKVANDVTDEAVAQNTEVVAENVVANQEMVNPTVEVENAPVDTPVTTTNAESGFMPGDITAETFAEVAAATEMTMVDNKTTAEVDTTVNTEEKDAPVTTDAVDEGVNEEVQAEEKEATEEVHQEEPVVEEAAQDEVTPEALGTDVQVISSEEVAEAVEPQEETKEEFKLDFADEKVEDTEPKTDLFNEEVEGGVTDSSFDIDVRDDEYSSEYDLGYLPGHVSKDNLVQEVTATVNELVKLNKSQKQRILMFEEKIEQLTDANKKLTERAREQSKDFEKLRANVENYRTVVGKLEAKNGVLEARNDALESKCRDQERTIYRLTDENKSLRAQNINNDALAQVLAEARNFIGSDSDYDEDVHYYRKAA